MFLEEHFFQSLKTSPFHQLGAHGRQIRLLPGIESTDDVDYVLEPGALQQAAGDHAAVSTLAVNRDGRIVMHLWRGDLEVVERPPDRFRNVPSIPLRLAAYVEHLHSTGPQSPVDFSHGNLRNRGDRKSSVLPGGKATVKIPIQTLDADASQPQPSLL
jgi:hypothetical protein